MFPLSCLLHLDIVAIDNALKLVIEQRHLVPVCVVGTVTLQLLANPGSVLLEEFHHLLAHLHLPCAVVLHSVLPVVIDEVGGQLTLQVACSKGLEKLKIGKIPFKIID